MYDFIELDGAPYEEDCVQVSQTENYIPAMKEECKKYMEQLIEIFPQAGKFGCYFTIKSFPHDFGQYYNVGIKYNDSDDKASAFAWWVQDNLPAKWDDKMVRNFTYEPEEEFDDEILDDESEE